MDRNDEHSNARAAVIMEVENCRDRRGRQKFQITEVIHGLQRSTVYDLLCVNKRRLDRMFRRH